MERFSDDARWKGFFRRQAANENAVVVVADDTVRHIILGRPLPLSGKVWATCFVMSMIKGLMFDLNA